MKLFVIGATGRTGQEIVEQALPRGHHVTAFVRSPESITSKNERLTVLKGNAMDENQLFDAMQNHDAVLSALGPRNPFKPTSLLHDSALATTRAMSRSGVRRLLVLSAALLRIDQTGTISVFLDAKSMQTISVTMRELPSISERRRLPSPAITPQALAWHSNALWMGSRDLRRIYVIDVKTWTVVQETEAPGIPWAAVSTGEVLRFTIGEGPDDDRYLRSCAPVSGFNGDRIACPEFTGSYLSFDGDHLYLSQWYKHRILKLDRSGNILRVINIGAEICGHAFLDGSIYVLRGEETPNEDWRIARLDPRKETPKVEDLARVPFPCRSLTFDGVNFWTNHRAANEIVSFVLPNGQKS